jgi:hypothetical protein
MIFFPLLYDKSKQRRAETGMVSENGGRLVMEFYLPEGHYMSLHHISLRAHTNGSEFYYKELAEERFLLQR